MDPWSGQRLTVAGFDRQLSTDIARLQEAVRELTQDQAVFRDPARLRARLRQYELDDEPGELEAMQAMMEITTMLGDSGPTRRRYWTVGLYAIMLVDKGRHAPPRPGHAPGTSRAASCPGTTCHACGLDLKTGHFAANHSVC